MQWEIIATWVGLLITAGSGVYKMGKQAQQIDDLVDAQSKLEQKLDENKDIPIKLATLETDVKYLIQGISELKQLIMKANN